MADPLSCPVKSTIDVPRSDGSSYSLLRTVMQIIRAEVSGIVRFTNIPIAGQHKQDESMLSQTWMTILQPDATSPTTTTQASHMQ